MGERQFHLLRSAAATRVEPAVGCLTTPTSFHRNSTFGVSCNAALDLSIEKRPLNKREIHRTKLTRRCPCVAVVKRYAADVGNMTNNCRSYLLRYLGRPRRLQ